MEYCDTLQKGLDKSSDSSPNKYGR